MRYKGFYSPLEFSLENIPFETLLLKRASSLRQLSFLSLSSHNTGIDTSYWRDAGLQFQIQGEGFLFEGSRAIEDFLMLDRVLEGRGSLTFQDITLDFFYQNGKISFRGKGVSSFCALIFGELPWREGDFVLKTGFFSSRLVFPGDPEGNHIIYKKGKYVVKAVKGYAFLNLLKTLGLFSFALLGVFLLKKALFIFFFLSACVFVLYFFSRWKSRRFFKFL
ncbi:MAG: hypothetical protein CVV50_01330 [Spirochaetae bacterium HGW-Spirochaetae-6]|nr:MAG: hypothetical protein CVV50_01330 [Spirochaetae bacterium HGW-Spirochaetae-6]